MTTDASTSYPNSSGNMTDLFNGTTANDTTLAPAHNQPGMEQFLLYKVTVGINEYYLWVIFALGFPGNVLSLLTILRMPTVSSSKMHVAMLAIVDNFAIVSKLLYHQLTSHEISLGDAGCKVRTMVL